MKLDILDISNKKTGQVDLPMQFDEDIRSNLISRAFIALRSNNMQPYGAMTEAGKRSSSIISKRRHDYRGSYGFGISRTPRKILSRRGTRMNWVGAFAPNTVGGRRAHPPKAGKILVKKLNKKERKTAIRAAISATIIADRVKRRGHLIPENYPFVLNEKFEELVKTKEVVASLKSLGFEKELKRVGKRNVRSGKGKIRGRKYKTKIGPLIVISKDSSITKAASNILGIDVVNVKNLNVGLLAPGEFSGRPTLWTIGAIETLEKEKMFR